MKKILCIAFLMMGNAVFSEELKVQVGGRTVILHEDFTWEYVALEESYGEPLVLQLRPDQSSQVKSRTGKFLVKYSPLSWISKKSSNDAAEFEFGNIPGTGFIMVVHDGLQIPLESLKSIMIQNAANLDPEAHMLASRPGVINGVEGEIVTYTATMNNLTFIFYSFITTGSSGTLQFTCFTLDSEFEKLREDFHQAMAGLVLQ